MIFLDIVGRCGNQMFQYAFAKKISLINDSDCIVIDFFYVYEEAKRRKDNTFRNDLNDFKARESFMEINQGGNKIYKYGSKEQIFVFKVYTKIKRLLEKTTKNKRLAIILLYPIMSYYGIYWYYAPRNIKKCKQKNKFIWGYFENPEYFSDIREVLINDFTPIYPALDNSSEMYKKIFEKESVCISIRKWEDNEPITDDRFVCDEKYYRDAIRIIERIVQNPQYVIFSNNTDWVKQHLKFPDNSIYESGNDPIYEKIRMMSSCNHFILSNSTFSWWAQYLGKDLNKVVVSPSCWNKSEKKRNPLIQMDFKKVRIDKVCITRNSLCQD